MGKIQWAPSEDAILRAAIASGSSEVDAQAELSKWGYVRTLEATGHRLRRMRQALLREQDQIDPDLLRMSISRKWL